jgi:hypothetical protein
MLEKICIALTAARISPSSKSTVIKSANPSRLAIGILRGLLGGVPVEFPSRFANSVWTSNYDSGMMLSMDSLTGKGRASSGTRAASPTNQRTDGTAVIDRRYRGVGAKEMCHFTKRTHFDLSEFCGHPIETEPVRTLRGDFLNGFVLEKRTHFYGVYQVSQGLYWGSVWENWRE